jgi:hypothetical protein
LATPRVARKCEETGHSAGESAEQAQFLEDHPLGEMRRTTTAQNTACNPASLIENVAEIRGEGSDQEKRNVNPSV